MAARETGEDRGWIEEGVGKKVLAEFVGTFILTASVVFPAIALRDAGLGAFLFIMFTAAVGLAIATWLFRDVSGAHVNPAVTFAMMVARKTVVVTGVFYWIAQLAGAALAAAYAQGTFKLDGSTAADLANLGTAVPTPGYKDPQIMMAEALGVFLLVSVVMMTSKITDKILAGFAIGATLLVGVVMTAPIAGGALNPAREFGPMLVADAFKQDYLWYYIVAPLIGAFVAAIVHMFFNEGIAFSMRVPKVRTSRRSEAMAE